jgi:hypothetical protein
MSIEDLKLGIFNGLTFIISFTDIENSLKILLLLVSIIYTVIKIYETYKKNDKKL